MTKIQRIVSGLVDVTQGFVKLLTFGMVRIHWSDKYVKRTVSRNTVFVKDLFYTNEISE